MRFGLIGSGLLVVAALGSLIASPSPTVSLPWALALLLGAALVLVAWSSRLRVPARTVLTALLVLGGAFLVASLFSTRWPEFKMPWLDPVYRPLSVLRLSVWGADAGTFNPNQTGGVAAVTFAIAAAALVVPWQSTRRKTWLRPASLVLAVFALAVVVLTGSRAALAGAGAASMLLLVLWNRRWVWLLAGALPTGLAVAALHDQLVARLVGVFLRDETLDTKLVARLDIWLSALRGIEDHPLTGTGLGVFNEIVPVRYPYESVGLSYSVSQAHNILLDTALTLGLPGLAGLLALLAGLVLTAKNQLAAGGDNRTLSAAVLAALTVYSVFGLTDALSFSSPFGFLLWILALGLVLGSRSVRVS